MPAPDQLSERELRVLEAVVQTYIETAEPAGSQTIARRFGLGVSPATIRNTMSELEDKGYLFHPHTSAGRIPTDRAYRVYVNAIMRLAPPSSEAQQALRSELAGSRIAVDEILRRAAQVLGVLTQELGVAVAPALDELVLERLELVPVTPERLLLVFNLRSGVVRTIFVEVPARTMSAPVAEVARILNERLGGLTLRRIRETVSERLREVISSLRSHVSPPSDVCRIVPNSPTIHPSRSSTKVTALRVMSLPSDRSSQVAPSSSERSIIPLGPTAQRR